MRILPIAALLLVLPALSTADVVRETVEYELPTGQTARGVLFYDESLDAPAPAILVVPEWWGVSDHALARAEDLAEQGYVTLVADMFGGGGRVETVEAAAAQAARAADIGLAALATPALDILRTHDRVDDDKIAVIGFCFGGNTALDLVKNQAPVAAAVCFHGSPSADAAPEPADDGGPAAFAPVLVFHGGSDPLAPADQLAAFVRKSVDAGVPLTLVNFPGRVHSFTDPDVTPDYARRIGLEGAVLYDEQAADQAFAVMHQFFDAVLR